ncbi:hypothetical protein Mapa_000857 [Marchantia paleacea]|nr:hypothetical protein Mapa_000857 [Marchantia paleacea]
MDLACIDQLLFGVFSSNLFLYKPNRELSTKDSEPADVLPLERLIRSLEKVLVHFYPLAGRLIKNEAHDLVRVFCNNQGAEWIHKRYDGAASEIIDEDNFQPDERLSGYSHLNLRSPSYESSGLTALVVQVTEFRCGTVALNVAYSHMLADGFSGLHFLKSWAEISRGEPISLLPAHERWFLSASKEALTTAGAPTIRLVSDGRDIDSKRPLAFKNVRYSRRKLEELKAEARDLEQSASGQAKVLSGADCASAHLWHNVTRISGVEHDKEMRYATLVNGRSKLENCPPGYFGNCIFTAPPATLAAAKAAELLSQPLRFAATAIHDAHRSVDDATIRSWIDVCQVTGSFFSGLDPSSLFLCSWQVRFPYYEIDFGSGIPANVLRNVRSVANVAVHLHAYPGSSPGDVIMVLEADSSILEQLGDEL